MKLFFHCTVHYTQYLLLIFLITLISSCNNQHAPDELLNADNDEYETVDPQVSNNFSVATDFILKDDVFFKVKGVVYVPGYPGYLPWEIEQSTSLPDNLKQRIETDIANIKALGANTIRFWGAAKYCYEALKNEGELNFIQTIWINGDQEDFHAIAFKETTKEYIREVIDKIYAVYTDNNPPLVAYIIGNELSEASIIATNAAHPEINYYNGKYIKLLENINATEAFIAEMADYVKSYEQENYGKLSLVSYANDIRTADIIDTPFLDFRSHNAYSYAVPYYRPGTQQGSSSHTLFQGWVEELKSKYPDIPLLITETGLSVSPKADHIGPPNYGYGGNTVAEQSTGILQNITDLDTANIPIAGVCIHEYLDAWWKFGLEDSYSQDPYDIEEWFGMVQLNISGSWYTTQFRELYYAIQTLWKD